MRYSAAEKLEIIRIVEQSHLSVSRTLAQISMATVLIKVDQGPLGAGRR